MKRSSSTVALALLQSRCSPDPEANLKKTLRAAERAAGAGAQIICTQELFRSQYFCQSEDHKYFALAEPIPGPGTDALQKLAKKHNVVVIASLFEKRAAGVYHNTAAIIDADGSLLGIYARRPGLPRVADALRQNWCLHLLGPVVSRSGAPDRVAGRGDSLLPDRHRLASE